HPDALGVLAEVSPAGQAIPATAADDVPLAADDLADVEILDVRADLDDLADERVAHDHRHGDRPLRPGVPRLDVHVGAADPRAQDLDQDVVDPDPRDRHLIQPKTRFGLLLHQGQHRLHLENILQPVVNGNPTRFVSRFCPAATYVEG